MIRVFFVGAIAVIAQLATAQAQHQWVTVASGEFEPGITSLSLDASNANGSFEAIRLKIDITETIMVRIALNDCGFRSGGFKAGEEIIFPGPLNFIDRIDLRLHAPVSRKTPVVVRGLQSASGALAIRQSFPVKPVDPHTTLWRTSWGTFDINPTAYKQSLYSCSLYDDIFDEIELEVLDNDVFIRGLKVTYHTGQTELAAINTELKAKSRTKKLRLKSAYPIANMELWYEPTLKSRARVEVRKYQSSDLLQSGHGQCPAPLMWSPKDRRCTIPPVAGPWEALAKGRDRDCVRANMCTPVAIFFSTDRKRQDKDGRIAFGQDRERTMSLGQAIVTVPKPHGIGAIERPSYWSWRDWWDRLSGIKEDPRRHFTIPKEGIQVFETPEQFIAAVLAASKELPAFKDHAFVYVHGFTVQFDDALYRLAQLSYDLGVDKGGKHIPFGLPFLFSWPTKGGILAYPTDGESARRSEAHLREFLELVITKSQAKNVHLIAHSMGNQPLLQVMKEIASGAHPRIRFNQVILAAPDVDKDHFSELAKLIHPIAKNITLYASSKDEAMILSRKLHSDQPRAGDVPKDGPVVLKEVHTIDASELSTSIFWTPGHSKYAEDTLLVRDIGKLVREGTVPPHDRTLTLGRRPVRDYWYWFFPRPKSPFG